MSVALNMTLICSCTVLGEPKSDSVNVEQNTHRKIVQRGSIVQFIDRYKDITDILRVRNVDKLEIEKLKRMRLDAEKLKRRVNNEAVRVLEKLKKGEGSKDTYYFDMALFLGSIGESLTKIIECENKVCTDWEMMKYTDFVVYNYDRLYAENKK